MKHPRIKNVLKDPARRSEYHIYAYRKLNRIEMMSVWTDYCRVRGSKNPPQGKIVKISTPIGLVPGGLPPS